MWVQVSFVLSQSTHLTDGQTDRQTDRQKDTVKIYEQNKSKNSHRIFQMEYSIQYLVYVICENNILVTILMLH